MADEPKTKTETEPKPKKVKAQKFRCVQTPNGYVYIPTLDKRVMFKAGHYATSDAAEIEALTALDHIEAVEASSPPLLSETAGIPAEVLEQLKLAKD